MDIEQKEMKYTDFAKFTEEKLGEGYIAPGTFVSFVDIALKAEFSQMQPTDNEIKMCQMLAETIAEKKYSNSKFFGQLIMKYISVLV